MKLSLKSKVILVVLLFTVILSTCTVMLSYLTYTNSFQNYYESLAGSIAKSTASVVDKRQVEAVADEVLKTYQRICDETGGAPDLSAFSQEELEAYYAEFHYITGMPEYQELLELLNQLREDNGVVSLYLGYHELNTMKDLYLVDASAEESCIPGDYDNVEADQVEQLRAGNFDMPAYITNYPDYGWLCSASATIENADGEVIGVALVDISMNEIMGDAQEFLQTLILLIAVVALIMAGLILLLVNRTIVLPINQMARAALQYVSDRRTSEGRSASAGGRRAAAGEEEEERSAISKLNIRTGDEIQALSEAIKTMELEINEYIQDLTAVTAEKERIGAELNVATQIQADMLPRIFPAFPEREEFDVYATMNPAKEVGGDFYDFFLVDDDHLAVVIADVSGKGVPAALFMVIAKTLIKNHAQNQEAPGTVFTQTNEQLCEGNDAGLFVTGWMGVLEISTGKFVYVNAGHNPPLLKRAGGTFEWLKSRPGFVLAGMEGVRYRENTLQLEPGDRLYLYTDGVTEATNSREELFGDERLQNALNEYMDLPVEQFLPKIKECIDAFVGGADQFDDITMLALDYQSKGETEHD
ncbi:PP2C family protein-serine/threonine phosphatase [Pseudoflavonifractor capillosus]|uniref:PP2C family protein-serine/threonine phosphatase n=1 Tax=Pseudoflavonifractor capillosus TaxID=106588 RepID=UPI001FAF127B|nr:PP2C family protein-serine/threonine phosphatase [Pseudoflavonifractor capillosus]